MEIKLPNLGEGADSGTVVNIFVKEGERVEKNQAIIELENEKAVASIPSTISGVISKIFVKAGDKISVGQRIASVEADQTKEAGKSTQPAAEKDEPEEDSPRDEESQPDDEEVPESRSGTVAAPPAIRKLARELGIDLSRVRSSSGRISMADLRAYIQRLQQSSGKVSATRTTPEKPAAERINFSKWGEVSKKPLSQLRQVISRRMVENWTTIPHVTQFDEADITALDQLRKKYSAGYEQKGTRLTLTSFAIKAVTAALKKHPLFNSSLDESANEIVLKEYFHIGIAVDTDAGLVVPVMRDADKKNVLDLSKELEELAKKARDRKLSVDEMRGGSFTISNQGGIGGGHFTPIVNKPEVAILGLGRGKKKPIERNGMIEPRLMLPIALSYDHRVIDGGNAARFIVDLVAAFENFPENEVKI
jgi:pyruvate dehydrogenase E2 component (dihydrolipoamide acetyltransferase)